MQGKSPVIKDKSSDVRRSERGDFFITNPGRLELKDGTTFEGLVPYWQKEAFSGEVVFNTGMSGYVESMTDPSYAGQILVFTFPLIGNYGVDLKSAESDKLQVSGIIVSEAALHFSHVGSTSSLLSWLRSQSIPILIGADTRAITKYLRIKGTMAGAIVTGSEKIKTPINAPIPKVSIAEPIIYNEKGSKKVILVDCGVKENILRSLREHNVQVKRVPSDYDYTYEDYDGVLLSNGPGDPTDYPQTIAIAKNAMKTGKPIFGICLGTQIMALAAGAKTYRLKFGHRGHNQPCLEPKTNHAVITSQNHGYSIDEASLPKNWKVLFRNLNDDSVEGIEHTTKPFFSVQFHPEACPGPTDTRGLFERFFKSL
jgi:carbamoyl-phosphate synthase small subunit